MHFPDKRFNYVFSIDVATLQPLPFSACLLEKSDIWLVIKGITWKIALTLTVVEIVTQGILLGLHIVPVTPQYIIPISGMMIGNAMVISILFLNRFKSEYEQNEDQIELVLSLGGTPKQAIQQHLMAAIKASMIPTIEAQKTIGLAFMVRVGRV